MLCGLPTSGKSTFVSKLLQDPAYKNLVILSTDSYIESVAQRMNSTYNDVFDDTIGEATRQLELTLIEAKDRGKSLIWDQTNLTPKSRKKKLSKIPSAYARIAIWFDIALDEALKRNQQRPGKMIPENVLRSMSQQFVSPPCDEGFDVVIKENVNG
jgi:predicted kinase